MQLRRPRVPLLLDGMFCVCLFSLRGVMYGSSPTFPCRFALWMIYLSVAESGVLKSRTVIVLWSVSSDLSVSASDGCPALTIVICP